MMKAHNKFGLVYLLSIQKSEIQILLTLCGFILTGGFLFNELTGIEYVLLYSFMGQIGWAIIFGLYTVGKIISILTHNSTIRTITGIVGLWAWNYIFLNFVIFDTTHVSLPETLLAIPILMEFWVMISCQFQKRKQGENGNV